MLRLGRLSSRVQRVLNVSPKASPANLQVRRCGVFASFDLTNNEVGTRTDEAIVRDMCNKIQHRGPDGTGVSTGPFGQGGRWALGHTRLAIVAPEEKAADQPFVIPVAEKKENLALVANGEIYNHENLFHSLVDKHGISKDTRISRSDCEVILHAYKSIGPDATAKALDGMFAFVLIDETKNTIFAGRDPCGIKPLYYAVSSDGKMVGFASELKALVGLPNISNIYEFPNGHYYTPETGFVQYYDPSWKRFATEGSQEAEVAPWKDGKEPTINDLRDALDMAVKKRLMSDVEFGMFLSGGIDSCIVGQLMMKHCREMGIPPIPSFTVGMKDGPDLMAARAMAKELGTEHHERMFTAEEAFEVVDKVVYHIETYNAELIRSAIPNWFLAEAASQKVKMVITGEGADELWAGYSYFEDASSPEALHRELVRIHSRLGVANLLRTDRMTMAHSLEARVPFLDVINMEAVMSLNPSEKMIVKGGDARQREKAYLRRIFEPSHHGITIPEPILWRMKAMQCEGVGENWVSVLQSRLNEKVSDAALKEAKDRWPFETPQTKEEYYYREVFESHYPNCERVPKTWEGGFRAGGAEWKSDAYTREGLVDPSRLTHSLQSKFAS
mmetsp:Transcript_33802/g.54416  ORF Transcript_33802/g.54416 Transcript_33802/m.54416 type:complete len:615 (-) Transcript_33802:169-2013(-)|eukprot:jgi/Bigna1/55480/estExt_Genewise1Plus.C_610032